MRTYIIRHGKPVIVRNRFGGQHRKIVRIWTTFDGKPYRSVSDRIADRRYDRWFGQLRKNRRLLHTTRREDAELLSSSSISEGTPLAWDTVIDHAPTQSIYSTPGLTLRYSDGKLSFASYGGDTDDEEPETTSASIAAATRLSTDSGAFGSIVLDPEKAYAHYRTPQQWPVRSERSERPAHSIRRTPRRSWIGSARILAN